jgi:metal iron transporter
LRERSGGEDGKNGHVMRPSIQTSDVSDRGGSGSGGGSEGGRIEKYLNMPKESLLQFKQVMIKFAKFIGPGFMVCYLSTHHLHLTTKILLMEAHRSRWHILILEITLRMLLLEQRSDSDCCSSY